MLRNDRQGFTLIELLIVVVIIGILAAIALPKFGETRERAYVSAMQSDLRNLQTSQEMYYSDTGNAVGGYEYWTGDLEPETPNDVVGFTASSGVSIEVTATDASEDYTATATHAATAATCTLTVGTTGSQGITCSDGSGS